MNSVTWEYLPCLGIITVTAFLVEATEEIIVGSPLTTFVHYTGKALLNSHHIECFSVSCFSSYEIVFLTLPHITQSCHNNLNPAAFLSFITDESPPDCLTLTYHLLIPCDDLKEVLFSNANFSCFTDGLYLKGDNGKYIANIDIT